MVQLAKNANFYQGTGIFGTWLFADSCPLRLKNAWSHLNHVTNIEDVTVLVLGICTCN